MSTPYCYLCLMDALFIPWLDDPDVAPTKTLAKDCRCDWGAFDSCPALSPKQRILAQGEPSQKKLEKKEKSPDKQ